MSPCRHIDTMHLVVEFFLLMLFIMVSMPLFTTFRFSFVNLHLNNGLFKSVYVYLIVYQFSSRDLLCSGVVGVSGLFLQCEEALNP